MCPSHASPVIVAVPRACGLQDGDGGGEIDVSRALLGLLSTASRREMFVEKETWALNLSRAKLCAMAMMGAFQPLPEQGFASMPLTAMDGNHCSGGAVGVTDCWRAADCGTINGVRLEESVSMNADDLADNLSHGNFSNFEFRRLISPLPPNYTKKVTGPSSSPVDPHAASPAISLERVVHSESCMAQMRPCELHPSRGAQRYRR